MRVRQILKRTPLWQDLCVGDVETGEIYLINQEGAPMEILNDRVFGMKVVKIESDKTGNITLWVRFYKG